MEIFISAGEASSDLHMAAALREMKKINPNISFFGLGGEALAAEGMKLLMHCREFSVGGGPLEVISRIPQRNHFEKLLETRLYEKRPQGALLIDSGEVNLRLAALLNFFKVPVVYYIPPKVWVWRSRRLEKIYHHVKQVLSILPFERSIYEAWEIPYAYVGHPLLDEMPLNVTPEQARQRLGISTHKPLIAVMPGSRHSEIAFHTKLFIETLNLFLKMLPQEVPQELQEPQFILPVASSLDFEKIRTLFEGYVPGLMCVKGTSHTALQAARAALIKSGTSTLESALAGTPMVITYQTGKFARWLFRSVIKYKDHVALSNLILSYEKPAVSEELILEKATPENLARALVKIYKDSDERQKQLKVLQQTETFLKCPANLGASPSEAVAKRALQIFQQGPS